MGNGCLLVRKDALGDPLGRELRGPQDRTASGISLENGPDNQARTPPARAAVGSWKAGTILGVFVPAKTTFFRRA